ncbi:hypothetical protein DKX38_001201 [Salix brachista]|uniref:F-box domain-containing protein n=1 Tax=Salix brachista TaxID=2182728 RepID=A0A5N5P416_9ROSI|nr:hypothetical protein DKX38_001201 [Salix brachista]
MPFVECREDLAGSNGSELDSLLGHRFKASFELIFAIVECWWITSRPGSPRLYFKSTVAEQLPEDMIVEILCRLPAKPPRQPVLRASCSNPKLFVLGYFAGHARYHDVHDCKREFCIIITIIINNMFATPLQKQCVAIPNPCPQTPPFSATVVDKPAKSPQYKVDRFVFLEEKLSFPAKLDIFSSDPGEWVRRWVTLSIDCNGFIGVSRGSLCYSNHDESRMIISPFGFWNTVAKLTLRTLTHRVSLDYLTSKSPDVHNSGFHFGTYAIHPAADSIFLAIPTMVLSYGLKSNQLEEAFVEEK